MNKNLQFFKHIKRYLRKTWIYSLKSYLQQYTEIKLRKKRIDFYSQFVKPSDLCFDIGANVGNRTQVFLELGAKVIAVEPQNICLKTLNKLFANNENVVIVGKAVGESEGCAELSICEEASTISTLSDKWKTYGRFVDEFQWTRTESVSITTLNNLITLYGCPKFCKIDVEGFELSVIKGLNKAIPYISFEINIEFKAEMKDCIHHLQSIGNVEFNLSFGESMDWLYPEWSSTDDFCNKIDAINDLNFWGDIYARFI